MPTPKPDLVMAEKVQTYLRKGLTYREIRKLTDKDLKSLWRWARYDVGELSTVE